MRTMYDSVTPSAIPANAALVAGYVDGAYAWSTANWARFPNSVKVRIAVSPRTNDGQVLDVEQGDATPAQAPGWLTMRRAAGIDPSIYCDAATWPAVVAACAGAGVDPPHYWIAHYDGDAAIPAGAVAKQYNDPPASGGNYDISAVADYWPGIDPPGGLVTYPTIDTQAEQARLMGIYENVDLIDVAREWGPTPPQITSKPNGLRIALASIQAGVTQLLGAVGAVDADVKTSASSVLAAIAAGLQVTLTAAQVTEIEAALAKALPGYTVNIIPTPASSGGTA